MIKCPRCGKGELELEILNFTPGTHATREYPGDPPEIEFTFEPCEFCGFSDTDADFITFEDALYERAITEAEDNQYDPRYDYEEPDF